MSFHLCSPELMRESQFKSVPKWTLLYRAKVDGLPVLRVTSHLLTIEILYPDRPHALIEKSLAHVQVDNVELDQGAPFDVSDCKVEPSISGLGLGPRDISRHVVSHPQIEFSVLVATQNSEVLLNSQKVATVKAAIEGYVTISRWKS